MTIRHRILYCCTTALLLLAGMSRAGAAEEVLTFDAPQCAGLSGFRAHWDQPIPVIENGQRLLKDSVVKDRGQTAVWDGVEPGPLAFDAVHRSLLVRFPDAGRKIAEALAAGRNTSTTTTGPSPPPATSSSPITASNPRTRWPAGTSSPRR